MVVIGSGKGVEGFSHLFMRWNCGGFGFGFEIFFLGFLLDYRKVGEYCLTAFNTRFAKRGGH